MFDRKEPTKMTETPVAEPEVQAEPEAQADHDEPTGVVIEGTSEDVTETAEITLYDLLVDVARAAQPNFMTQGAKETDQKYMLRLVTAISEIPEPKEGEIDEFEELDEAVKDWFNSSVELVKSSKPIATPSGFVSKFGKRAVLPADLKPAKEPKVKKPKEPKEPKVKKPKVPKEPKARKPRAERPDGITAKLCQIILSDLTLTPEGLKTRLIAEGLTIRNTTAIAVFYDVLRTVKMAKRLGLWKESD